VLHLDCVVTYVLVAYSGCWCRVGAGRALAQQGREVRLTPTGCRGSTRLRFTVVQVQGYVLHPWVAKYSRWVWHCSSRGERRRAPGGSGELMRSPPYVATSLSPADRVVPRRIFAPKYNAYITYITRIGVCTCYLKRMWTQTWPNTPKLLQGLQTMLVMHRMALKSIGAKLFRLYTSFIVEITIN
jgi:hypothetical protein